MSIIFDIYTKKDISPYRYVSFFFETIEKIGLEFTKIAHYEPINKVFETEKKLLKCRCMKNQGV